MAKTLRAKAPVDVKPSKPKILIFGKPGVGKTWASLDFPSVYYLDTEGGANLPHYIAKLKSAGGVYLGPDDGANDFDVVVEEIATLATTKHKFKTLVVDSFSKLFNTEVSSEYERMQTKGRDMDKTFGAEKKGAINDTRKMIRWFEKLDMNVVLICHEKAMWKDGKEAGATFDAWDKLEYELHLALRIQSTGTNRSATVTKTRLEPFPLNAIFDWSYKSFADRYGRSVIEGEVVPTKLASQEQIDKYASLIETIKVDQKLLDRWEENCPDIKTLDAEGMDKRIAFLSDLATKAQNPNK